MASKNGFTIFFDWLETTREDLDGEEFKELIFAIALYQQTGEEPQNLKGVAKYAFKVWLSDFKRYQKRVEDGRKGGETRTRNAKPPFKDTSTILEPPFKDTSITYTTTYTTTDTSLDIDSLPMVENCAADAAHDMEGAPNKRKPKDKPPEYTEEIKQIVDYLNGRIGTSYRPSSKDTRSHITARLREGYTVEDFETVIDKVANVWIGTEMERYLRPSTLFGTKFESYLNGNMTPRATKKTEVDSFMVDLQRMYGEE